MCAACRNRLTRRVETLPGLGGARANVAVEPPASLGFAVASSAVAASVVLDEATTAATTLRRRHRRRRLWELRHGWQCSIVGTCLRLGDLRRTAVRLGLYADAETLTDYELHGFFVHDAKTDGRVARLLQKMLDGEHEGAVRRFSRCRDVADLTQAWEEAVEKGEIAGAYWAAMTHPALDEALETRLFGEVHMMSHLAGASQRGDRRAVATLTQERDRLTERLRRSEADRGQAIAGRDAEIERLDRALTVAERSARAAEAEAARLARLIDPTEEAMRRTALEDAEVRIAALERQVADKAGRLDEADAARRRLEEANRALLMDLARSERALQTVAAEEGGDGGAEIRVDLAGRRILYVGGRKNTVSHAKRLVERCNGCLLHHDGGLEQSVADLESTLSGADAVVFPVDCVSHNAINCVKRVCERRSMPFRALRSSGQGSFVDALGDLAS